MTWLLGDRFQEGERGPKGTVVRQLFEAKFPEPGFMTTVAYVVQVDGWSHELVVPVWEMSTLTRLDASVR